MRFACTVALGFWRWRLYNSLWLNSLSISITFVSAITALLKEYCNASHSLCSHATFEQALFSRHGSQFYYKFIFQWLQTLNAGNFVAFNASCARAVDSWPYDYLAAILCLSACVPSPHYATQEHMSRRRRRE